RLPTPDVAERRRVPDGARGTRRRTLGARRLRRPRRPRAPADHRPLRRPPGLRRDDGTGAAGGTAQRTGRRCGRPHRADAAPRAARAATAPVVPGAPATPPRVRRPARDPRHALRPAATESDADLAALVTHARLHEGLPLVAALRRFLPGVS